MSELPPNWVEALFGEINTFSSRTLDPSFTPGERFELYSVPSFPSDQPEVQTGSAIGSTKQLVAPDDVLVCKINPRINRVWQVMPATGARQIASSEWIVMRAPQVNSRFMRYYFRSPDFRELICEGVTGVGGSLTRAQPRRMATFGIPLAPLPEQKRIADKLDAVLARVDACRGCLDRVPAILKRFRQSVLAAATSGKLTEEWRTSKNEAEAWPTVTLLDVAKARLGKMLDKAKNQGVETPYLRNINVRWFGFDLSDIQMIRVTKEEARQLAVTRGDVLVCEGGEPGRCTVWEGEDGAYVYQKALHRVRVGEALTPEWLCYSLKDAADSGRLAELFTGTTIKHLTGVSLGRFEMQLPPLDEQHEIVRRVETLFAHADRIEARYNAARAQVEHLTPALLAKAFRGELVPQDPNDEPASVLLERIRALGVGRNKRSVSGIRDRRERPAALSRPTTTTRKK